MSKNITKNLLVATALIALSVGAFAADIDVSAATDGIKAVGTALGVVIGAMTLVAVTVYGLKKVMGFFGWKS